LLPAFPLPDVTADDQVDVGVLTLPMRSHLLMGHQGTTTDPSRGPVFTYLSTLPDRFLGHATDAVELVDAITYDGTWIHLPPASLSHDARAQVCAAVGSPRGVTASARLWTPATHRRDRFRFLLKQSGDVNLRVLLPKKSFRGTLQFRQTHVAVPPRFREAALTARPGVDVPALLAGGAAYDLRVDRQTSQLKNLARGRYSVRWSPDDPKAAASTVTYDTTRDRQLRIR